MQAKSNNSHRVEEELRNLQAWKKKKMIFLLDKLKDSLPKDIPSSSIASDSPINNFDNYFLQKYKNSNSNQTLLRFESK